MPGLEPTKNYLAYRIKDPKIFQPGEYRWKQLRHKPKKEIYSIFGSVLGEPKKEEGKLKKVIQALRFPKTQWKAKEALKWVKSHPKITLPLKLLDYHKNAIIKKFGLDKGKQLILENPFMNTIKTGKAIDYTGFVGGILTSAFLKDTTERKILEFQKKTIATIPIIGEIKPPDFSPRLVSYPISILYLALLKVVVPEKLGKWIFAGNIFGIVTQELYRWKYPFEIETTPEVQQEQEQEQGFMETVETIAEYHPLVQKVEETYDIAKGEIRQYPIEGPEIPEHRMTIINFMNMETKNRNNPAIPESYYPIINTWITSYNKEKLYWNETEKTESSWWDVIPIVAAYKYGTTIAWSYRSLNAREAIDKISELTGLPAERVKSILDKSLL